MLSNLDSDSAIGPDGIKPTCPKNLLLCSYAPSLCSIHPHLLMVICHLFENQQTLTSCIKRCKNRSLQLRTNQLAPNHDQGLGINHHFQHQILPLLQWLDFRSSIWFQTRSLDPEYAASALPTMDGRPKCRTRNQSHWRKGRI